MAPVFNKRPTNYQPNLFTESKQEFTELEKKIVVLVVNQIGHLALKGELMPKSNVIVNIPFSSLTRDHHQQIADAAESLQSKRLVYRDDSRNKFQFGCEYGQLIKNGKLAGVVRNPNYRGVTVDFWNRLSAVGHEDVTYGTPYCGKGEPSQVIRVGHSSPPCLFKGIEVFGGQS